MGNVVDTAKEAFSSVLPMADQLLQVVEDPIKAVLPETEGLFNTVSQILGNGLTQSSNALEPESEEHQQVQSARKVHRKAERQIKGLSKRDKSTRQFDLSKILDLLLSAGEMLL
jgi:hypothetical protein